MGRMRKDTTEDARIEQIIQEIEENSPYKRREPLQKTTMTVREMGDLLGLKKTDRYWLVHKNFFKTEVVAGQMRVDIKSFEKWYANQIKYQKVTGEEPGLELKQRSYSAKDIARILNVPEYLAYQLMKKAGVKYELVDYWKRFPKEAFDEWYAKQNLYKKEEDRELEDALMQATMPMPEMARLLGITRSQAYSIIYSKKNDFEIFEVRGRKRISKVSFYRWYKHQKEYMIRLEDDIPAVSEEENKDVAQIRRMKIEQHGHAKHSGNQQNLTRDEAAVLAGVDTSTISKWIKAGYFQFVKAGGTVRIRRDSFEQYLNTRKENE